MTHHVPAGAIVVSTGPGKVLYQLWPGGDDPREPAGTFMSLPDAMSGAGHLMNAHWVTKPGQPDRLFLADPARGYSTHPEHIPDVPIWMIQAPGVAREYADTIPDTLRAARRWSPLDGRIIEATIGETTSIRNAWWLTRSEARTAGERLAARFATGRDEHGPLSTVDVHQVLTSAYQMAYATRQLAVPADVIDEVAAALVGRLVCRGVPITGAQNLLPRGARVMIMDPKAITPGLNMRRCPPGPLQLVVWLVSALIAAGRAFAALNQALRRIFRPVMIVPVPAGRLPVRVCAALSVLISHWLIPLGITFAGALGTGWPHGIWQPWLFWYAVALAAEKLVNMELRPDAARKGRA